MQGKNFICLKDFSAEDVREIVNLATELKKLRKSPDSPCALGAKNGALLAGKSLAMIFQKPSNRTRVSFEVGIQELGGRIVNIRPSEIQMGVREPIADIAKVMSRYVHGVMIRAVNHADILEFAEHASVPVINGLSDLYHPCQAVADILTIEEHKGELSSLKLTYIGDGNNVCVSLINICELLKISLTVCCPEAYKPSLADGVEGQTSYISFEHEPNAAVAGADVVYTDSWISMGQEAEAEQRRRDFANYSVTKDLLSKAASDCIFLHCLPAHRGEEVSAEVIEGPQSKVFDQAENRLHAQKAVMALLMKD